MQRTPLGQNRCTNINTNSNTNINANANTTYTKAAAPTLVYQEHPALRTLHRHAH